MYKAARISAYRTAASAVNTCRCTLSRAPSAAFAYFPVQGTVEGMIASSQLRLFGRSMSAVSARVDEWFDMSLPDVRAYETVRSLRAGRDAASLSALKYSLALAHSPTADRLSQVQSPH